MEASLVVCQQEPVGPSTKLPDSGQGPGKTMRLASRTQARAGFAAFYSCAAFYTHCAFAHMSLITQWKTIKGTVVLPSGVSI